MISDLKLFNRESGDYKYSLFEAWGEEREVGDESKKLNSTQYTGRKSDKALKRGEGRRGMEMTKEVVAIFEE